MFNAGASELIIDVALIHNIRQMCERGSSFVLRDLIYAQAILFRLACSVRTLLFRKIAEVEKKEKKWNALSCVDV